MLMHDLDLDMQPNRRRTAEHIADSGRASDIITMVLTTCRSQIAKIVSLL